MSVHCSMVKLIRFLNEDIQSVAVIRKIENELHDKEAELRTLEENMIKSQKEAERQAAKMKSMSQHQTSTSSSREAELQTEVDKCMVHLSCASSGVDHDELTVVAEYPQVLDVQTEHAQYRAYKVYAL